MTTSEVWVKFHKYTDAQQVEILLEALDYMNQYNGRSKVQCIALAMGIELED